MPLRLRLSRGGTKKRPFYTIVVADSRSPRDGRFIEKVGTYNPMVIQEHPDRQHLNEERIKYWLSVGAQPSERVQRLLARTGLAKAPSVPAQTKQHLPKAKAQERAKLAAENASKDGE